MNKTIKILILEDVETDAQLAEYEIKKSIQNYELKWVDNKDEFVNAIHTFNPEIIISDYNLPTFDGLSALKIKKDICPETPFIIFTGSINEDTAVNCMKAGAADYIIKEHLKRLGPAIVNALEQKEIYISKIRTEQELIKSEQRFHRLADNMPDMIYRIGLLPFKHFEYINPAAESITGYTVDEFYSNPELGSEIIHPDDLKNLNDSLENGNYFYKPIITKLIKKDGTTIWFEQRNIPVYNKTGNLIAIEGIGQDITEKKNAETLKQALFSIAQASNSSKSLFEFFAEVHRIILSIMPANNFYIALYNKKNDEVSFPYFIDELDEQPTSRKSKNGFTELVINSGKSYLCDTETTQQLISEGKVEQTGKPHAIWLGVPLVFEESTIGMMAVQHYSNRNAFGEKEKNMLEYVSSQVAKVIVYKQAEEQIMKLSKAVEQSPVSIFITNTDGIIEYVNNTFRELTGYSSSEIVGKNPRFLKSGKTPQDKYTELWDTIKKGQTWKGELINQKKNGDIFIESANISPIIDENGKIINYLAVKEDITLKKQIEKELIDTKEKAEESDRLKTAFLQNMSHEIRTPMNAIVGFSDLIEMEIDNPQKIKEYIDTIKLRSNDLLEIINELLDIARIESGQLKINAEITNLSKIIDNIFEAFSVHPLKIEKTTVALLVSKIPNYINSQVLADAGKLKQIFINLIHNALKFTTEGSIKFGFYSIDETSITFFVSDTGPGVPENMRNIIFERFRKSADETSYVQDGIGLGLAIVKGILKIMNGDIWMETEENKGTTFYFKIPYIPTQVSAPEENINKPVRYEWSKFSILIVEDEHYNALLFKEILGFTKINCVFASTGKSAINAYKNNGKFDIVLLDIKLPDMTGYDVVDEIKKVNPNAVILAQTAYASDIDKQRAISSGCSGFISKPIKRDLLLEIINDLFKTI